MTKYKVWLLKSDFNAKDFYNLSLWHKKGEFLSNSLLGYEVAKTFKAPNIDEALFLCAKEWYIEGYILPNKNYDVVIQCTVINNIKIQAYLTQINLKLSCDALRRGSVTL
jgi:hypothetical protein